LPRPIASIRPGERHWRAGWFTSAAHITRNTRAITGPIRRSARDRSSRRAILKAEAQRLLREGALNGMFSDFPEGGAPKYVWSVDAEGEVYEAKIDRQGYHGYRLEEDDNFRDRVLREWRARRSRH
jgi:hypothetical protein